MEAYHLRTLSPFSAPIILGQDFVILHKKDLFPV